MKKIAKGLSAVLLAATLTSGMAITACANHVQNDYSTFDWSYKGCTTKNITTVSRYVTASMEVYGVDLGNLVDTAFGSGTGAYGTTATANNPVTDSPAYDYRWRGAIYNSGHPNSGIVASFTKP